MRRAESLGDLFCTALCGPVKNIGLSAEQYSVFLGNPFLLQQGRRKAVLLTPSYLMGKVLKGMDLYWSDLVTLAFIFMHLPLALNKSMLAF